ncbi:MAG: hypothetical protein PHU23_18580, partial [Dehalococcoidales bacterium]|nr:hypothetical protein [Dehalococcoidales bacterium]
KHKMYKAGSLGKWKTTFFYFAVPVDIARKASEFVTEEAPYAGILSVNGFGDTLVNYISTGKRAHVISKDSRPLTLHEMAKIVRDQSATLCRLATKVCKIEARK